MIAGKDHMHDRISRVNEQVKREISIIILQDLSDPRLQFVSILRASVSRDLRNARIFYSVLGEEFEVSEAQRAFYEHGKNIRRILASRIKFRFVPELIFTYDQSLADSVKIDETLKEIYGEVPLPVKEQSQEDSDDRPESEE